MSDLNFIKQFNKITIRKLSEKVGVAPNNLYTGKCSEIKTKQVRKAIECEIAKLYINEYKEIENG